MAKRQTSKWAELPLLLHDSVMGRLTSSEVLTMGLVCKAWRAARKSFHSSALFEVGDQDDMSAFSNALPGLSAVTIDNTAPDFSLQPLSACSALRSACICNDVRGGREYDIKKLEREFAIPSLDLSYLPATLQSLAVRNFHLKKRWFNLIKFSKLESLVLELRPNSVPEIWSLLQMLPDLKVGIPSCSKNVIIIAFGHACNASR